MRSRIVAGNWKMNKNAEDASILTSEIAHMIQDEVKADVKAILAPPFVHLAAVHKLIKGIPNLYLAAQNCHHEDSGAFTGEVSVPMLRSVGVSHVILGHSERREYFNEDSELLKRKTDKVIEYDLTPVFCCGESLSTREAGDHFEFVKNQLTESLFHLQADQFARIIIAYEPIWAIGTGKTASAQQAQEMHEEIRKHLASKYGKDIANGIAILYGGSCKPDNAREIFAGADVDGGLIGGASLKSRDFTDILKSF